MGFIVLKDLFFNDLYPPPKILYQLEKSQGSGTTATNHDATLTCYSLSELFIDRV